jgi:hypothetical protein
MGIAQVPAKDDTSLNQRDTDPKARKSMLSDGTIGSDAFRDGVVIVLIAWAVLFLLPYSLRHHNI